MGTPEGDDLDILATLVEAYEEKHFPIEAQDPD
jgi:HTH-type transcriptional regulator/antitoxin HigA